MFFLNFLLNHPELKNWLAFYPSFWYSSLILYSIDPILLDPSILNIWMNILLSISIPLVILYLSYKKAELFYILEEEGMLTTEREETTLYDGREWRTHYWVIRKDIILKYAKDENKRVRSVLSDKQTTEDISDEAIYDALEDDAWVTRKMKEEE